MVQPTANVLQHGQEIQIYRLPYNEVELGLSWDFFEGMPKVDLDAAAVLFDSAGQVVDAAFYKQLSACDGAVTHSGDKRKGGRDGDDETIRVEVD